MSPKTKKQIKKSIAFSQPYFIGGFFNDVTLGVLTI